MRRTVLTFILCLGALHCVWMLPEQASAFEIRVRGEGKLYADVQAAGTSMQVAGVLRDELGQALPQRKLGLVIDGPKKRSKHTMTSDMQGRFRFQRELPPGEYKVDVSFLQTEHLDGAIVRKTIVLKPATYQVYVQAPPLIVGQTQGASIRLRATANDVGVSTPLEVYVNDSHIEDVTLDHYGRGVFDAAKHLKVGNNQIRVVLVGNKNRRGVQTKATLRYAKDATIKATLDQAHVRLERGLRVKGTISDDVGPLNSGTVYVEFSRRDKLKKDAQIEETNAELVRAKTSPKVSLKTPGQPSKKAPTTSFAPKRVQTKVNKDGEFVGFLGQQHLSDGVWTARVIYEPSVGTGAQFVTNTAELDRSTSRWALHFLGLLTILIGVIVLAQRSLWLKVMEVIGRFIKRKDDAATLNYTRDEVVEAHVVDDVPDDLEAPSFDAIAGYVWDVWRDVVVSDAQMDVVVDGEVVQQVVTGPKGRFVLKSLPAGQVEVHIVARGFARSKLAIKIPHSGDLRYIRVDVIAMALKIRRFYQAWVRKWHGEEVWGRLTPRQIESALFESLDEVITDPSERDLHDDWTAQVQRFLESSADAESLSVDHLMQLVTALIEESYYSQRVYEERVWQLFVQLTRRLEDALSTSKGEGAS